jgi:cytoskeletal protein RodZ
MLDNFSILTISPFVGVLNEATKSIAKCFKKDINRYIPIFSLVYGVLLGIAGYYIPDLDFGNNLVEAIFAGLVGGGAATGVHQTFHQISSKTDDAKSETSNTNNDDDSSSADVPEEDELITLENVDIPEDTSSVNNDEDDEQDSNASDTISDDVGDIQDDDSCTEPDETL